MTSLRSASRPVSSTAATAKNSSAQPSRATCSPSAVLVRLAWAVDRGSGVRAGCGLAAGAAFSAVRAGGAASTAVGSAGGGGSSSTASAKSPAAGSAGGGGTRPSSSLKEAMATGGVGAAAVLVWAGGATGLAALASICCGPAVCPAMRASPATACGLLGRLRRTSA